MKVSPKLISFTALFALSSINYAHSTEIAPSDVALTLAQALDPSGQTHTYLVTESTGKSVKAINLSEHFDYYPSEALSFIDRYGYSTLSDVHYDLPVTPLDYKQLLAAGGQGSEHIAAGTNYLEHGEEADIDEVFLFPKFSKPTPNHTKIRYQKNVLLDYEVELCMRWVKPIVSPKQSDGYAGLFVCGDFTDRAELLRKIDVDNVTSGHGFSDAKSGQSRFPTGPYIVVPKDWNSFLKSVSLTTYVNGEQRQQTAASEMIREPKSLIEMILEKGEQPIWRYQGQDVTLFGQQGINPNQNLVTGTPAGVVYNTPGWGYRISKSIKWFATFSFLDSGPVDYILEQYIEESFDNKSYLQAGDKVQLTGTYLGSIDVDIIN
ncbi:MULTISPECIES: fumarylacetoacetate hydrolase family protein [Vibrio]|uniref:fumarylacetoacetate hydrolase family protein n=1 Tax=Vibrio TaxID=662 RepID=UPI000C84918B|nr:MULTISPECIES: fumarylacetoacetate hydrolase family protein [unclassified Vibrio]PMI24959.1 fumarylacetoacetate hydrolase [Vibrio sp. 10N.286.46.E10]PMI97219.1 fumarylacetoacetate hydrolase [Vibrio sp. 10N.286.45.E10]PTO98176.1 fumarylacetoacetate hydrolase [Vibrio sp. 10N.286.48.B8]PTP10571.1 fumarylacetoacetate hydrolase [Vibrio sp. 10N.286.45.A3]PTQ25546.1 fumarylacetoacetate hydrolase [Vibrio sp. 10N.286.46.E10]